MKSKAFLILVALAVTVSAALAAYETFGTKEEGKTGLMSMNSKLNTNFGLIPVMSNYVMTNDAQYTVTGFSTIKAVHATYIGTCGTNAGALSAYWKGATNVVVTFPTSFTTQTNSVAVTIFGT